MAVLTFVPDAGAQTSTAPPNDSLFKRARRMVSEGKGAAGRAIVDSLLRLETEGSTGYGNALYWRGALAETAVEAERDYRRVIVEYPVSAYADDALLAIAELEQARGDRAAALQHLQRFVREHPVSTARGIAALAAARLAFEQRDTKTGCGLITDARASTSATDVELRNQIDYFNGRCAAAAAELAVAAPPAAPVETTTVKPPPPNTKGPVNRPATPTAAPKQAAPIPTPTTEPAPAQPQPAPVKRAGNYTIQVAAYNTRPEAERLIAKLAKGGLTARVSGSAKPFRVRLDFYATRQEAAAEVAQLKKKGIIGFVTTEEPPAVDARP